MSFSSKISSDDVPDFISVATRESEDAEPTSTPINASRTVSEQVLEFRTVTGEETSDSFFYSILKRMFRSAYKFFSYVSSYFTSCFSRNSFRDVTRETTFSENPDVLSTSIDGVVERAAATIFQERREHQKIIREYDLHYLECSEFYEQQEDFLKNYLEYLKDALDHLREELEKSHRLKKLPPLKGPAAAASGSEMIDFINVINERLESLKEVPELGPLIERTQDLLFKTKKGNDKILQFSARDLATMIQGQLGYFQMRRTSSKALSQEVRQLMGDQLELLVSFDPQANRIAKTEFVGRRIAPDRIPPSEELPSTKSKAEHARLSLLNYMSVLKKKIQEDVNLITQEIERLESLRKEEVARNAKKDYEAYRKSPFRYKI